MAKKSSEAKKQAESKIAFTVKQIEQFHRRVEGCLGRHTGQKITLQSSQGIHGVAHNKEAWKTAGPNKRIIFDMIVEGDFVFVATGRSNDSSVAVRLKGSAPVGKYQSWITWSDTWVKRTPELFDFIGLSIGFYSGPASSDRDVRWKIVRAEWDDPRSRGEESAQPHWHVDPDVLDRKKSLRALTGDFASTPARDAADGPIESLATANPMLPLTPILPPLDAESAEATLSMKHLHLGMSGWFYGRDKMPGSCWQHPLTDAKLDNCIDWIEHTLDYMTVEMEKLRVGEAIKPEQVPVEDL